MAEGSDKDGEDLDVGEVLRASPRVHDNHHLLMSSVVREVTVEGGGHAQ